MGSKQMKMIRHHIQYLSAGMLIAVTLSACGIDPLTYEDSPNMRMTAIAYVYRVGDSDTYISISFRDKKREVKVLKLKGTVEISFKWVSNGELNIYIPDRSLVRNMQSSFEGIKINVIEEKRGAVDTTGVNCLDS